MTTYVGLLNLGNTCFLNSCVQVLKNIPELNRILTQDISYMKESPDTIMLKEWLDLYSVMTSGNGTLSPNKFVHMVQQIANQKGRDIFTGWAQNDIEEFLLFLIECFHNSLARPAKVHINGNPENSTDEKAIICYKLIQSVYASEYSKIILWYLYDRNSGPRGFICPFTESRALFCSRFTSFLRRKGISFYL